MRKPLECAFSLSSWKGDTRVLQTKIEFLSSRQQLKWKLLQLSISYFGNSDYHKRTPTPDILHVFSWPCLSLLDFKTSVQLLVRNWIIEENEKVILLSNVFVVQNEALAKSSTPSSSSRLIRESHLHFFANRPPACLSVGCTPRVHVPSANLCSVIRWTFSYSVARSIL